MDNPALVLFLLLSLLSFSLGWKEGESGAINYDDNCDFQDDDIAEVPGIAETCGGICIANSECTHFTWFQDVCYVKHQLNSKPVLYKQGAVCGYAIGRSNQEAGGGNGRLSVFGNRFQYNGLDVFLSGVNLAWNEKTNDFGNGRYTSVTQPIFNSWLSQINANGGNSIRVWIHWEAENTPAFDGNGMVTGTDGRGTMVDDLKQLLDAAQAQNILVIFCLWNGAWEGPNGLQTRYTNLYLDDNKLQSYLDNALTPMVRAVAGHSALAAWEIINEPEGLTVPYQSNSNACFDTNLMGSLGGYGWSGYGIPWERVMKFINWHTATIKSVDPTALVTVGAWNIHSLTDNYSDARNYYKDTCLVAAGGRSNGVLDFYQVHTYEGAYEYTPFNSAASYYGLDKPLIIGEMSQVCSGGINNIMTMYNHAYNQGYQGIMDWQYNEDGTGQVYCSDFRTDANRGLNSLRGNTANGVVNFPL